MAFRTVFVCFLNDAMNLQLTGNTSSHSREIEKSHYSQRLQNLCYQYRNVVGDFCMKQRQEQVLKHEILTCFCDYTLQIHFNLLLCEHSNTETVWHLAPLLPSETWLNSSLGYVWQDISLRRRAVTPQYASFTLNFLQTQGTCLPKLFISKTFR